MPKLIIDERAMALMIEKLLGQPIDIAVDGSFATYGVYELVDEDDNVGGKWQPHNAAAKEIVLATEACIDIVATVKALDSSNRKRTLKRLTVPVCSLVDRMPSLRTALSDTRLTEERLKWRTQDRASYVECGKRVRRLTMKHVVRRVRNQIGAHLDAEAVDNPTLKLTADDLLPVMFDVLAWFMVALNHDTAFSWARVVGPGTTTQSTFIETLHHFPLVIQWEVDPDGHVLDVDRPSVASDPRDALIQHLLDASTAYNTLNEAFGGRQPPLNVTRYRDEEAEGPRVEKVLIATLSPRKAKEQ